MPTVQSSNPEEVGDVDLWYTGERFPVWPGPNLLASGWRGGLFVQYVPGSRDFTVEKSDGNLAAGFLLYQSEKYTPLTPGSFGSDGDPVVGSPENYLSHQFLAGQGGQNVVTMICGGARGFFKRFETIALNGAGVRAGGPITYSLNENLYVSENGLFCNDSIANLNAAGITTPVFVGFVSAVPSAANLFRLSVDLKF